MNNLKKNRPNLSEEKRIYIKFMYKYLKMDADQIFKHPSLNENGQKIQKRTVQFWLKRIDDSGDILRIKQKGNQLISHLIDF